MTVISVANLLNISMKATAVAEASTNFNKGCKLMNLYSLLIYYSV